MVGDWIHCAHVTRRKKVLTASAVAALIGLVVWFAMPKVDEGSDAYRAGYDVGSNASPLGDADEICNIHMYSFSRTPTPAERRDWAAGCQDAMN